MSPMIPSHGGWLAIQAWAQAIRNVDDPRQIPGYAIMTRHLGSLLVQAQGQEEIARRIVSAPPQEVSRLLRDIQDAEVGRRVSLLVPRVFEDRLRAQAALLLNPASLPTKPPATRPAETSVPIADPNRIVAYGASLKVGVPKLLSDLASLLRESSRADSAVWKEDLKRAERMLSDLARYQATINATNLNLIGFPPATFAVAFKKAGEAIAHLKKAGSALPSYRSHSVRRLLLEAAESFDPAFANSLLEKMMP